MLKLFEDDSDAIGCEFDSIDVLRSIGGDIRQSFVKNIIERLIGRIFLYLSEQIVVISRCP